MKFLCLALLQLFTSVLYASEPLIIKGIIKDKETESPIPFAHVMVGDVVNISNIEGEFVLTTSVTADSNTSLRVSYMGYEEFNSPLEDASTYQIVYLNPSVTLLDEVTVMTGPGIMQDVFNRFHLNYEMRKQHMVGYYQESMADQEETMYIDEGIMDIYTPSNIDKYSTPLVKPLRTRKKVFQNSLESEDILGGNASDMAQSSIWRSGSFLDQKNRKNYDYFYTGTTNMGSYEVLIVEFEPKNTKGNTTGKIYIEQESLAIIQIEYQPIIERYSFWESVSWKEEYDQKDGVFQLVGVTFNGNSLSKNYNYEAILVINESKVISEVPDMELAMNIDDSFFENAEDDFSDSFWTGFNFVKLDSKIYEKL